MGLRVWLNSFFSLMKEFISAFVVHCFNLMWGRHFYSVQWVKRGPVLSIIFRFLQLEFLIHFECVMLNKTFPEFVNSSDLQQNFKMFNYPDSMITRPYCLCPPLSGWKTNETDTFTSWELRYFATMVITRFQVSLSLSVDFVSRTSSFLNVKLGPEEDHMWNLWFIFYTLSYRTWYVLQARIHRPWI